MIFQTIIFPGNTIVKKNSQRVVRFGNHSSIRPSKAYDQYQKAALPAVGAHRRVELIYPVYAHYFFYRRDKRKFDLSNMCEGLNDMMQKANLIDDDDFKHLIPVFHSEYCGIEIDKKHPRARVILTDGEFNNKTATKAGKKINEN